MVINADARQKTMGIRVNQIETLDNAINNVAICSMTSLSECDGIGIMTLQKCFNLVIGYKPQPSLNLK